MEECEIDLQTKKSISFKRFHLKFDVDLKT